MTTTPDPTMEEIVAKRLELPMMCEANSTPLGTAFTVPVDHKTARTGITAILPGPVEASATRARCRSQLRTSRGRSPGPRRERSPKAALAPGPA